MNGDIKSKNLSAREINKKIKKSGYDSGFSSVGILAIDDLKILNKLPQDYDDYLEANMYGDMTYLEKKLQYFHEPDKILPGVQSAIVVAMNYLNRETKQNWQKVELTKLENPENGYVSIYARGRDYHKVLKKNLKIFADKISSITGKFGHRACVDSVPIFEIELAVLGGIGWRGKNTLLLNKDQGSTFFLGVLLLDYPLETEKSSVEDHCGTCMACIDICPTKAFLGPYKLNATRCISYLTIEHKGVIPLKLRPLIGNRIYGCDDCQLICPWNKFAKVAQVADFDVRNGLDDARLVDLFSWTESEFRDRHSGSSILRIGYHQWLRNIAIALGNVASRKEKYNYRPERSKSETKRKALQLLRKRITDSSPLVSIHASWALSEYESRM
ncbi:MAG: tRNA epoxyqueuosine(34) reductase QueG [Burkholderiaceae bacterium]|nr:MAG: tRNA epoxyqueuosine(34) reductase QueG [Burkholderiaceae bacterium]